MEPTTKLSIAARLNRYRPIGSAFCSGALMAFALHHWVAGAHTKIWLPAVFCFVLLISAIAVQTQLFKKPT